MMALCTIAELMTRVLGHVFGGPSWAPWRAVVKAAFALAMTPDERASVCELTGRTALPSKPVREVWFLIGRRAGKSIVAALVAVYAVTCRSYALAPGEVGTFMVIASDRRQARVIKRYVSGLLRAVGALEELIADEAKETIALKNGLAVEIHTCSFRSLRGYTCIGAAVDEVAFWSVEGSANPDREVLIALRAAMASVPEAMLVALTTTYAQRGEVWRVFREHYGNDASADVLVVKGSTLTMNPTIDPAVVAAAYADDPVAAAAEYGAEFRTDVESLFSQAAVDAVTMHGRDRLPPVSGVTYEAFADAASGSGKDSFTVAIGHQEGSVAVLDAILERRPPFSPETAVSELAAVLKEYRVTRLQGDRFGGEWPRMMFRQFGIDYQPIAKPKSEIYAEFAPLLNSGRVELLDHPRFHAELLGLERRAGRSGKDHYDHAPNRHDDLVNSVAGVCVGLTGGGQDTLTVVRSNFYPSHRIGADGDPVLQMERDAAQPKSYVRVRGL